MLPTMAAIGFALLATSASAHGGKGRDDDRGRSDPPINERCERGFSLDDTETKTCPNRRGGRPYEVRRACCTENRHGYRRCKPFPTCNPNSRS